MFLPATQRSSARSVACRRPRSVTLGRQIAEIVCVKNQGGFTRLASSTSSGDGQTTRSFAPAGRLGWLLRRAPDILLIPGTSSRAHLQESTAAGSWCCRRMRWLHWMPSGSSASPATEESERPALRRPLSTALWVSAWRVQSRSPGRSDRRKFQLGVASCPSQGVKSSRLLAMRLQTALALPAPLDGQQARLEKSRLCIEKATCDVGEQFTTDVRPLRSRQPE